MEYGKIEYVSVAKGIGIILVVAGHCLTGEIVNFIYLFHMPLFFMISGYLFTGKKDVSIVDYVKKKIKTIYIPYVFWNMFFLIFHNVFFDIGFYSSGYLNSECLNSVIDFLKNCAGILTLTHMELVTAPTWYLRVYFVSSILYFMIGKYLKRRYVIDILAIVLYSVVYVFYYKNLINGSVMIYSALVFLALALMRLGNRYRYYEGKYKYTIINIFAAFACLLFFNEMGHINLVSIELENPFFLLCTSVCGYYFIFGVSKRIRLCKMKRMLGYIGNHTMIILVLHYAVFKFVNMIYAAVYNDREALKYISNAVNVFWAVLYIIMGVSVPLLIEVFYQRIYTNYQNLNLWRKSEN